MAKKKSKDNDKQDTTSLIGGVLNTVKRETTKGESGGVELRSFAERWLMDSNVVRFGELCMYAGDPASGKSQYMSNMAALFVRAGGAAEIIDTEHKSNAAASIIPNVGEDVYYSDRFGFSTAGSIDVVREAKKGDPDAQEEHQKAWMAMLTQRVKAIKNTPELKDMPIFLGIDSLLGAASSESRKKYDEGDGAIGGRTATGMARAASLTEWFANFSTDLAGTNITVAFTNHGKTKIDMGGPPSYGKKPKHIPGGDAPQFHSSTILYFTRGAPVKKMSVGGRSVYISVRKNSFGDDQRQLQVTFYYDILKDANDVVVRDENGNPMRKLLWDWDEATADLLKRFCLDEKKRIGAARAVFPGLSMSNGRVSCKTHNIEGVTPTEFGRFIMKNDELYQKIMEIPRLTIHHAPKNLVLVPDWSDLEEPTVEDGEWDKDPSVNVDDDDDLGVEPL
ncbi:MAG TPA: hypothetical protein ENH11_02795 [Candidatus Acetothermia bacterium]|nr:hypothetical protein [Candidatus Acetothermia bacterium]